MPVVYTSATLSLAALEYFVHLNPAQAPADLVAIPADIPESVARDEVAAEALPSTWRAYPAPEALAEIGTAWVCAGKTAVLVVPSVIVPQERNFLLNPAHPHFGGIRLGRLEAFSFDPRLSKR